MGVALLVAAVLMIMTALNRFPGGGEATALTGGMLVLACGINFALGALMTLGIGLYAPCMIMVSLLGMNPTAAFPIMMGSCAFLMQIAGTQFIAKGRYDLQGRAGPDPRRHPGGVDRRLPRPLAAACRGALAGRRGGGLHGRSCCSAPHHPDRRN